MDLLAAYAPWQLAAALAAAFGSAFVRGLTGFGMAILLVPILALALTPLDAVLLAIEHEIDVLFVDPMGKPQGRVWSVRYGSVSDIRRGQLEFLYGPKALPWVRELIAEKINNQIALLAALPRPADDRDQRLVRNASNAMEDHLRKVRALEGEVVADVAPTLRGWEGAASKRYFESLNLFLPGSYRYATRSAHPALDPFNSLLNYGYGMLYGKVESALVKAGIDPYVGVFHRDDYNRPALVFDVIEKYRLWVDYVVVQLCRQEAFHPECFRTDEDGGVYLEGLGKRILVQSVNDYLSEVVAMDGLRRSREEHVQRHAHRLAQVFLESK